MHPDARQQLLTSPAFRRLVVTRWRVSLALTVCLFVLYYGYVLLVALNKPLLATPYPGATPVGIPIGAAVIIGSWILTAIYIVWANRTYDPEVDRIRNEQLTASREPRSSRTDA